MLSEKPQLVLYTQLESLGGIKNSTRADSNILNPPIPRKYHATPLTMYIVQIPFLLNISLFFILTIVQEPYVNKLYIFVKQEIFNSFGS